MKITAAFFVLSSLVASVVAQGGVSMEDRASDLDLPMQERSAENPRPAAGVVRQISRAEVVENMRRQKLGIKRQNPSGGPGTPYAEVFGRYINFSQGQEGVTGSAPSTSLDDCINLCASVSGCTWVYFVNQYCSLYNGGPYFQTNPAQDSSVVQAFQGYTCASIASAPNFNNAQCTTVYK